MTRITILEQKLVQLEEKRKQASIARQNLEEARVDIISRMIHEYFEDVLEKEDVIEVTSNRVTFKRPQEGYSYLKDLVELYFKTENWRDETANEIQTSFYSTNENSEFELRRMILIGKVGQIVLDFKDDILVRYNQIMLDKKEEITEAHKVVWGIEKNIKEVEDQIRQIEKENILSKVESEGIRFELPEGKSVYELPNLGVKFNWTVNNVKEIKVLNKTASGKSADVELKVMHNVYDTDIQSYKIKEQTQLVEKVRMDNIESFLLNNTKRISAS
jgi:hypothetical protein